MNLPWKVVRAYRMTCMWLLIHPPEKNTLCNYETTETYGDSMLMAAVAFGYSSIVKYLLANFPEMVNHTNCDGETAFGWACLAASHREGSDFHRTVELLYPSLTIIRLLARHGSNISTMVRIRIANGYMASNEEQDADADDGVPDNTFGVYIPALTMVVPAICCKDAQDMHLTTLNASDFREIVVYDNELFIKEEQETRS